MSFSGLTRESTLYCTKLSFCICVVILRVTKNPFVSILLFWNSFRHSCEGRNLSNSFPFLTELNYSLLLIPKVKQKNLRDFIPLKIPESFLSLCTYHKLWFILWFWVLPFNWPLSEKNGVIIVLILVILGLDPGIYLVLY